MNSMSSSTSPALNDTREIYASLERLVNAVNTNDLNGIMKYYVPDNVPDETLVVFDGIPPRQYVGAAAFRQDWANFLATYPNGVHAEVNGWKSESEGNLAYGRYFFSVTGIATNGKPLDFTLRITDVYRKINGKWLAIHEHASWPVDLATRMADLSSAP